MIQLGSGYIEEQDELDDAANVPRMEAILASLAELVQVEAAEAEPPEDEEMASSEQRADEADAPPNDRAGYAHPIRRTPRKPAPLYTGRKDSSWRL
jgi:hypothetical protein